MASRVVSADYDYTGEDDSQLTFKTGDKIIVLEEDESGWWTGKLEKNGNEGYFPSTYILNDIDDEQEGNDYDETTVIDDDEIDNDDVELENDDDNDNDNDDDEKQQLQVVEMNKLDSVSKDDLEVVIPEKKQKGGYIAQKSDDSNEGTTNATTANGTGANGASPSEEIDYNNYFANSQKVEYDGPTDASAENYYSGEVLNLKFNPSAKSRFGLASHYMSYFASLFSFLLGTSAFAWSSGSRYLSSQSIASPGLCLLCGLYCFFLSFVMFFWEYIYGGVRKEKTRIPYRTLLYFAICIVPFMQYVTALAGVLWLNCAVFSLLAFMRGEEYSRKQKKAYSDEDHLSPMQMLRQRLSTQYISSAIGRRYQLIKQQSQLKKYLFVLIYILFNLAYIFYWAAFYSSVVTALNDSAKRQKSFGDFSANSLIKLSSKNGGGNVLTAWYPMAKMFGNLLDINCAFILLPVCRSFISSLYNISSDQRSSAKCCNFILSFMPLDKAIQFHKLCAMLVLGGTVMHTWAHFMHYADVPATYELLFGPSVWISGSVVIVCMQLIFCTSLSSVRNGKFELFWYTHHLFVIFFVSILLHGANSINPNFGYWFLIPGLLYILERTLRELRSRRPVGVVSISHMNNKNARIFCLELSKIVTHSEGQYIFIKAPIVSKLQWHPFTISSPPEQKTMTVHIRNMGDGTWTDRVQQFFQAVAPGKAYSELYHRDGDNLVPQTIGPDGNNLICIDGPMAAPTQHLGEYGTSIVIGAGIGVTPVRSTLQSIIYFRFKRGIGHTFPDHAYCVWIVNYKQLNAYRFMCRTLKESEDELYDMQSKNSKQMEHKFLQVHIFVTSSPKDIDDKVFNLDDMKQVKASGDRQKDLGLWGPHYDDDIYNESTQANRVNAPFDEIDIWKCLIKPTEQPTQIGHIIVHKGRPKWEQFFEPIQQAHLGNKIGVMFCGPNIIAQDLKINCGKFTDFDTKTVFILHKENF